MSRKLTTQYTTYQKGIAKRKNRTMFDMAKSMAIDATLLASF
jgi:hypothetical protein